jgi:hypothetical protein
MSKRTIRAELTPKAVRTIKSYYTTAAVIAIGVIGYTLYMTPRAWQFPLLLLLLVVVNGWLWLTRFAIKVELKGSTLRWKTIRTAGEVDTANIKALRPFSLTPFVQIIEISGVKRVRFIAVAATIEFVDIQEAINEQRPELKIFVPKTLRKRAESAAETDESTNTAKRDRSRRKRRKKK